MPLVQVPERLEAARKVMREWEKNAKIQFGSRNSATSQRFHVKRRRRRRRRKKRNADG